MSRHLKISLPSDNTELFEVHSELGGFELNRKGSVLSDETEKSFCERGCGVRGQIQNLRKLLNIFYGLF